jgi:tripartite ATP-independent transporter DctM subunit
MTGFIIAAALMMVLLLGGVWIAVAVGMGALVALLPKLGNTIFALIGQQSYPILTSFGLIAVPLFIFLGQYLGKSGIISIIYGGLKDILRGVPGGLEQVNMAACGAFAAMQGSSIASAAAMGSIGYPELVRRGYDRKLSLGTIGAGGTLGLLIPPSISFIIIGMIAQESIGQLFMAGLFPGILLMLLHMLYIAIRVKLQPALVPPETEPAASNLVVRVKGLLQVWPFLIIIGIVLGSIYFGIASPTESAALGVIASIATMAALGLFSWDNLWESALATVRISAMLFLIMITAQVAAQALVFYGIANMVSEYIIGIGSPLHAFLFIGGVYVVLGCFFEPTAMVILTLPMFVPAMVALGFSKVLFGVMTVVLIEMAALTPPVGMNLFVVEAVTEQPLEDVVKGTAPFLLNNVIVLILLYLYPQIALWLPSRMFL